MSYKRGVYFRTPGAFGPGGGAETSNVPGRNQRISETVFVLAGGLCFESEEQSARVL